MSTAYRAPHHDLNNLPDLNTATDVIDFLAMSVADLVIVGRDDINLPEAEFNAAFTRAFDYALPKFLARLDKVKPGLANKVRRQFATEQEDRDACQKLM